LCHIKRDHPVLINIQLSPTVTKLCQCHIKCDHPACVSVDGGGGQTEYGITSSKLKVTE